MRKQNLRKQCFDRRKQLDWLTYKRLSQQVQSQLVSSECFVNAQTLALYSPINNEVATAQIFAVATELDKQIYFPRVAAADLEFFAVRTIDELVPGAFGVAEPVSGKKISVAELDLIVVPGVAFDLLGHRLGYGRGFYDRLLVGKSSRTVTVGLCFETQLCEQLPAEAHDQRLDFIATETKFIPCHS